ncbi:MAG: FAD-binding oxidoreductase [Halofilum sp. (in: g-proteobacteria)]|nr:FAD-binding oxidoreductase [Halofilum sp. (in: g-proteobacteria)]
MTESSDIAVVGAGVVGLACARALQRDGHRVTLYDPAPAGDAAAAWGSAGILTPDMLCPLSTPDTLASVPGMLLRPMPRCRSAGRYLFRALPWLARFAANARPARVEHNARALAAISARAIPAWRELLGTPDFEAMMRPGGWVTAFESERGMAAGRRAIERRIAHGAAGQWLDRDDLLARVPQLAGHVVGGVWFRDAHYCIDTGSLLDHLARRIESDGGILHRIGVDALGAGEDAVSVRTADRTAVFDHVFVCAGARSRKLARTIGDEFPLDTERGYHVTLPDAAGPSLPVMSGEHKFVTTPMVHGVRLTGTSELGGLSLPPDARRYALLRRRAAHLFPQLDTAGGREWMGFRPTFPDSLPVIGPSARTPRVFYALGHQHLGLSLAAVTAQMAADTLAGRAPAVDPHSFRMDRF